MEAKDILNLKFKSSDLDKKVTIKEFMYELMKTLWTEMEGFSGKRPWGNSGWDGDLIICLIENEIVGGVIDRDGYIEEYNKDQFNHLLFNVILPEIFK